MIDECYNDPVTRDFILKKIGRLHAEIRTTCSDQVKSTLQRGNGEDLKDSGTMLWMK